MSGVKDVLKKGWHPEKNGTSITGQMKSLVGRGEKETHTKDHVARPLTSLRDPASFGPPPKRINAGVSGYQSPQPSHASQSPTPDEENAPPPPPYRTDTTGLTTSNLPPPPVRRDRTSDRMIAPPPLPASSAAAAGAKPAPPKLPPRLPPRKPNIAPPPAVPESSARTMAAEPPQQQNSAGLFNQGALDRLGAAGVSVPGLGIGKSAGATASEPDVQSRFAELGITSTSSSPWPSSSQGAAKPPAPPPSQGTTLAQKQAALKTAAAFRQDPRSVSLSDAKEAASTFNNFRQRHGDQVAAGLRTAGDVNQKYGVASTVAGLTGQTDGAGGGAIAGGGGGSGTQSAQLVGLLAKKKVAPPPPPPKKKADVAGQNAASAGDVPPPIPMSTRPQF